jgi:hypothetical protein
MLALLTLFPLGAVNMAQALRDDRVAAAAANANSIALAWNIRHNGAAGTYTAFTTYTNGTTTASIPAGFVGPSFPVYVDFFGAQLSATVGQLIDSSYPAINPNYLGFSRVIPSIQATNQKLVGPLWFTLPDDITFGVNAVPQVDAVTSGVNLIDRGGRYTWAYWLRCPQWNVPQVVDMSIVVYSGRSTQALSGEVVYPATGTAGTNIVTLNWTTQKPAIRRGGWVLDVTPDATNLGGGVAAGAGYFYRVVNITDLGNNQVSLELQTNLRNIALTASAGGAMAVMEDVAEVIDKGSGWQP